MKINRLKSKTPFELGRDLFGKYKSKKESLSIVYKQEIKKKIAKKIKN